MPQGTPREAFLGVSIMRPGCQAIVPPMRDAPSKQIFACLAGAARTYTDRPTRVRFCPHDAVEPLVGVPVAVGPKGQSQIPSGRTKGPEPDKMAVGPEAQSNKDSTLSKGHRANLARRS